MAGEYIWAKNKESARKKILRIKPKDRELTYLSRAPKLDEMARGRAYYYILDVKKKGKVRQVRIRKDYYMKGYYSVHSVEYTNGRMTYERLIGYHKTRKGAEDMKRAYKHRNVDLFGIMQ